jgi:molybdopterin synthase catalytic subunit
MARSVLLEIAGEAAGRLGTERVAVVHRVGELEIGEVSVAVAVSSPHRAEAYDASRYVIEEIKKRLPVWKEEHYTDGASEWVEGTVPPGTGAAADADLGRLSVAGDGSS